MTVEYFFNIRLLIEIKEAEKEHSVKQKEVHTICPNSLTFILATPLAFSLSLSLSLKLAKAYEELNKRIYEHDKLMNAKPELTLTVTHDYS